MAARQFDDAKFLNNPNEWPCWPVCPVKRYEPTDDGLPNCGIVIGGRPIVYETNMFMLPEMTPENLEQMKKHKYDSMEELVADGWLVD